MAHFRSGVAHYGARRTRPLVAAVRLWRRVVRRAARLALSSAKFDGGRSDRAGVQGVAGGVDVQLSHGVIGDAQAALLQRSDFGEHRVDRRELPLVVLQLAHQLDQGVPCVGRRRR